MLQTYTLQRGGRVPLYEQLYLAIREDILSGAMGGGEKLPSKRALAEHLGVGKITVETAYAQLLAEGYVTARQRSGYYVEALDAQRLPEEQMLPEMGADGEIAPTDAPSAALFPFSVWARLMRGVILDEGAALLRPTPGAGLVSLREAICDDLRRRRGMQVRPEQIFIGAGTEYFYHLLLEFFGRERVYALEALGHSKIARIYAASGVRYCPIEMDESGICPEALEESGAEVLHLSPSHHYPTGIVTPIGRRQAILRWLRGGERFLIEDDYDSEFRFSGRPIPPMQTMDADGRVIYMNTFSKTIAPALRISYMILPMRLLGAWKEKMGFYSCTVPAFEQLTLTRFLRGGYFERHLSRMRKHYREQLGAMLTFLAQEDYADLCRVLRADAGLHFLLQFQTELADAALKKVLVGAGLDAPMLSEFYVEPRRGAAQGCVVVGYADMELEQFTGAMARIAAALREK